MASQPIELFDQFRVWMVEIWVGKNPETSRKTCRESLLQGGINVYVWILNWWRWYLNLASWWGREGANKLTGTELIQSFSHLFSVGWDI